MREDDAAGERHDMEVRQLRAKVDALLREVSALRRVTSDRNDLEDMVAQLRDANQNLVLATVSAQALRDEAEAANKRQNEFLAMLAHELRNPLAPISMAATLLERTVGASPQLLHLHAVISRQVDHMARLLDDLLDAARISSGKITLMLEPLQLADVIEQTLETIQPRIQERQQQLAVELPDEPVMMEGDQVRLTQVFSNLLVNASKFTGDQGRIMLSARLCGDSLLVSVQDNGTGIAADVLPHIFDLFTQGPRSLARSEGGLGIGLNVVRNLVGMHGGTVRAHSDGPGCGSVFTVTLPVSRKSRAASPAAQSAPGAARACRILLVEDNVDASNTLESFLALEGHVVNAAYSGTAGLAMAIEQRYDILICDIGLPGLDGFDLIRELRHAPGGDRLFAIALSGYGHPEDRARAIDAGFDRYFVKPVDGKALLGLIAQAGGGAQIQG